MSILLSPSLSLPNRIKKFNFIFIDVKANASIHFRLFSAVHNSCVPLLINANAIQMLLLFFAAVDN